jgi:chitinase
MQLPRGATGNRLSVRLLIGAVLMIVAISAVQLRPSDDAVAASTPSIALSSTSGAVGSTISITGRDFPRNVFGQTYWAGSSTDMPSFRTDRAGNYRVTVRAPARTAGAYVVSAGAAGVVAGSTFTIVASASVATATPTPTPTPSATATPAPTPAPGAAQRRVVGYYPLWLPYLEYSEKDIDFAVITHVAHFSVIPRPDGTIEVPEEWGPGPMPSPALVNTAHAAGAKVILVVGGDLARATTGFAAMAATQSTRQAFVRNLTAMVTANGYDGVDIDWESPVNATDRSNLNALVAELRASLGSSRTLSLAVPAAASDGQLFDITALLPYVDWFGAMTYGLHGAAWSSHSGHTAPLYSTRAADTLHVGGDLSVDASRLYYLSRGVPAAKLLVGVPFYGEKFATATAMNQTLTSTAGGAINYRDIAPLIGNGWTVSRDTAAQAPFLVGAGGGIITYDDPQSIAAKCSYIATQNLGGAIIWHLGKDYGATRQQPLLQAATACR